MYIFVLNTKKLNFKRSYDHFCFQTKTKNKKLYIYMNFIKLIIFKKLFILKVLLSWDFRFLCARDDRLSEDKSNVLILENYLLCCRIKFTIDVKLVVV